MQQFKILALLFFCLMAFAQKAAAQATLSVQGTIQKSTGVAVDDGDYAITFRLYDQASGGTLIWSETQDPVEIIGGVYSVTLGSVNPLTAPFDKTYYLGISVGSGAEHTPRSTLTSAPYALSLLGQDNKFPSTGNVGIGTTTPGTTLAVDGSIATGQATTTATAYTVAADDHVIFLDHTANQNVTLPAATAANAGRHLMLVNKEAVAKTLTASSYLDITNATSTTIPAKSVVELQSDGSVWRQTGGYVTPTASAKAYVYCSGLVTSTQPISWNEKQDIGGNFNSNTFTAPRTGVYQVSGQVSLNNTSIFSPLAAYLVAGGTCQMGIDGAYLSVILVPANTTNTSYGNPFSGAVYMNAGETLTINWFSPTLTSNTHPQSVLTIAEY